MRSIIVDGYNVIRSEPRLQSLERTSLEYARNALVQTLASSPRLANDRIVVVFDGRFGSRGHVHSARRGRVEILYSGAGQTADEVIVQQAAELAGTGQVVVVSDDGEVRERSRASGCEVSGAENLLKQVPGSGRHRGDDNGDDGIRPTLSTAKRGNPRRTSRNARRREIRF